MDTNRHEFREPAAAEGRGVCCYGKAQEDALDDLLRVRDAELGFTPRTKDWTELRKRVRARINQR